MVTATLGTADPVASSAVPTIEPVMSCAGNTAAHAHANKTRCDVILNMFPPKSKSPAAVNGAANQYSGDCTLLAHTDRSGRVTIRNQAVLPREAGRFKNL